MSKFLKIVLAIFLSLVIIAGVPVGIITQGFRKWDKLKTSNVSGSEYKSLQDRYNDLENENNWLRNKFMYADYNVLFMDSYSAIGVDGGNNSEVCYAYEKVGYDLFFNSFRISNIQKLFISQESVFEIRFFDLYNVYEKKDNSFLTDFRIEDKDKRITNDFINSVTFNIGYSEEITDEQKTLIEAGTDESSYFNARFVADYSLNKETNLYDVDVILLIDSLRVEN